LPKDISQAGAKEIIKHQTFYGREKENLIYPIGLANLILHGIDDPHIWHGNALTGHEVYGGLFKGAPSAYEVVLTKRGTWNWRALSSSPACCHLSEWRPLVSPAR